MTEHIYIGLKAENPELRDIQSAQTQAIARELLYARLFVHNEINVLFEAVKR